MAASLPIHAFLKFILQVLCMMFFPRHWLLSQVIIINPFPNKPWFLCVYSTSLLKALWERKRHWLLSHIIIINPFPNKPWFLCVYGTSLLKALWERKKNAGNQHFLLFLLWPYSIIEINHHFSYMKFVVCKCFQFGHVQYSVV